MLIFDKFVVFELQNWTKCERKNDNFEKYAQNLFVKIYIFDKINWDADF